MASEHLATIGGRRIAYRRAGAGPPIVFLHGFAGDHREWDPVMRLLADTFTVVAWDSPGAGHSDDPPTSFRLPDFADSLATFIEELGLSKPHIAGLSVGGSLAIEFCGRHPLVPRSLVLASAYAGWAGSLGPEAATRRLDVSLRLVEGTPGEFADAMLPSLVAPTARAGVTEAMAAMLAEIHPDGFKAMAHSAAEADLRDVLPRIRVPTLVIHGDRDQRAPREVADAIHSGIAGSRMTTLSEVGHVVSLEAPDRVAAEIRAFVSAVERDSS
jgi:pimeloyl-ACP methyl ester carboxylesterase